MANAMDDILSPFRNKDAPPSVFGAGETPEQQAARIQAGEAARAANFERNTQGSFGGAAAQVPGLESPPPAPIQDAGMSVAPDAVSEQANMSIAPVAAPQPQLVQQQVAQQPQSTPQKSPVVSVPHLSKQQLSDEEKAYQATLKATESKANLESDIALAQSMHTQDAIAQLAKRRDQDQTEAAKVQQDADKSVKDWQSSIDDYKKVQKEGPEKLGAGQSILAAIAQGLGAFGSAMTGGPNYAMQIISKAADARVRKWEKDLDESRGTINAKHNAVAFFRQKGMDARAASSAAKQTILDDAMMRGDALTQQYKSEAVQSSWQQTKVGLEQQRVAMLNQRSIEEQEKRLRLMMSMQPKQMSVENQIRMEGMKVDVPQKNKDGNLAGYKTYIARSATDAEKIRSALVVRDAISKNLSLLKKHVENTWQSIPNSTAKKQTEALTDDLRTQFGVLRNLGALSDKDYEVASQVGDPTAWLQTDGKTISLANNFESRLDGMIEAEMKGRGLFR